MDHAPLLLLQRALAGDADAGEGLHALSRQSTVAAEGRRPWLALPADQAGVTDWRQFIEEIHSDLAPEGRTPP